MRASQAQPLSAVLGGTRDRIASGVSIGIQDSLDQLVEKVEQELRRRLPAHQDQDQAGLGRRRRRGACARRFGDIPLMVDANAAYTLADAAHLARLDAFDLMMIEQPLDYDDVMRPRRAAAGRSRRRSASTSRSTRSRIARDAHRRRRLPDHQHQAGPGRRPSPSRSGSTTSARRTACRSGTAACSRAGIGRAHNIHLVTPAELHAARRHRRQQALLRARSDRAGHRGRRRRHHRGARPARASACTIVRDRVERPPMRHVVARRRRRECRGD